MSLSLIRFCSVAVPSAAIAICVGMVAGRAAERTIAVARSDCRLAIEHAAAPDVAYRPGVDVHGRPVAPADVEGPDIVLPDVIPIFISADLRRRFGLRRNSPLLEAEAGIGIVEFQLSSGRLFFNGVELSEADEQALAALCREGAAR